MTLTIELTPELERQLRAEAGKAGMDASRYVTNTVEEHLRQARRQAPHLSRDETELLQQVNLGLSERQWQRYHELVAKRRAEILTADEQKELIAFSDQIERANARRIAHLIELAKLRQTSLETLMSELGIQSPAYV
jgi:hypothetical protein